MATTTKSKFTRTTKKPAKAVKTTVNKATKKASSKNIVTKTTVNNRAKTPLTPLERIRSAHFSSAFLYVVFAGLVIGFVSTSAAAVKLGIQTRDQFASDTNVVLGSASEVLYNIEPKYILAAALLSSAVFSVFLATKLRSRYEATLANRTSGFRWLAFGLSSALLLTFINLLAGIEDLGALKLSAFLIILTTMFSFIAERENVRAVRPKWLAFNLSLFSGAMAWLPLIGTLIGTSLYGMERFGWHVYTIAAAVLLGFTAFAITQFRHVRAGVSRDYLAVEEKYMRIDMLTKFAAVIIVILALK